MDYYSAIKGMKLIHATKWMNHENIMLSKISPTQRTNIVWFHLHEVFQIGKFIEKI